MSFSISPTFRAPPSSPPACGAAWTSVFSLVLIGTYIGIGALAHDYGFGLVWVMLSTLLVWVAPGQVILISALGTGATYVEAALTVSLSSARLLPMVVTLLPLLKGPGTRDRDLLLPAHFTAVSMWVESLRLLPSMPREERIPFCNGLAIGFMASANVGTFIGFYLVASLPWLLTAALLFLTPMSFLCSTARNAQTLADRVALGLGLVLGPLLAWAQIGLDLLWTGLIGGSRRLRHLPPARDAAMSALSELAPYLVLILVGFLPTEIWRMLGFAVARGIDEASELLVWVRAVAVTVLAGVIAKLIMFPPGALADVPLAVRLAAMAAGFLAFLLVRRSVFAGVAVGEAVLILGASLVGR